jgi:hypothetical protein
VQQRGTEQADSHSDHRRAHARARELLAVDDILQNSRAASAVFLRPAGRKPPALGHLLRPGLLLLERAPALGHATGGLARIRRELLVGVEPFAKLHPKRFVFGIEIEIHRAILLARQSACTGG